MVAGLILAAGAVLGALINRYRGGGFPALPRPGRSLWVAAPLVGLVTGVALGPLAGTLLGVTFLLGSVNGWGSYFSCGHKAETWQDDPEVGWIDKALHHVFGPEWAANLDQIHPVRAAKGHVVYIGGEIRPFTWRRRRACLGMALRGLHYTPFLLIIPILHANAWATIPTAIATTLFAPAYHLAKRIEPGDHIGLAELLVGGLFGLAIAGQYLVVA